MIMIRSTYRRFSALSTLAILGWATLGLAQDAKPKDEALDDLLKKVEEISKPKDTPAKPDAAKPGEVAPKDKDLDSLLDKLGQTKDEASPDGKKPEPPPAGGDDQKKPEDDKAKADAKSKPKALSGKEKDLDEVLDEIAGKKKKPKPGEKPQGQKKQGEDEGPLGDLVKQMREVEPRLSKPDTGEQTRQKQTEIVKRLDTMIEQMRKSQSQSQAMRMMRQGNKPGQPGQDSTGALANGPPPMRPEKPKPKGVVALDKNPWGHLPPELRAEMDNVFKEEVLPSKEDLVKRYYLSVSKKSLSREE
jgi:hypothetical protein